MRAIVSDPAILGGDPRLEGTRIGVLSVYRRYEAGESPEEIAASHEDVTVADVHNALAFAFDNPERVREIEDSEREAIDRVREERPVDPEDVQERA